MLSRTHRKCAWRRWAVVGLLCAVVLSLVCAVGSSGSNLLSGIVSHVAASPLDLLRHPSAHAPAPTLGSAPQAATPGQFTTEQFTDRGGATMTYYLYVPQNYTPTRTYPVVLILHGNGERDQPTMTPAQNRAHILSEKYVDAFASASAQATYPSFIIIPQIASVSARWVDVPGGSGAYHLTAEPTVPLKTTIDILATVEHAFAGADTNRVYITGISMGAYGVWDAIERWPQMFAAAAPISGAGDPTQAHVLASLPIWDFHGSADTNVPVSGSRLMYAALAQVGGNECYTEFPGGEHALWNTLKIYNYATFLSWIFAQTQAPTSGQPPLSCKGLVIAGVAAH